MKRRDFLLSSLAGPGLVFTSLKASDVLAQTGGPLRPLATASASGRGGLVVARVYPGANRRSVRVMTRTPQGETWRNVALPDGFAASAGRLLELGRARVETSENGAGASLLNFEIQFTNLGSRVNATFRGAPLPGEVESSGTTDEPGSEPGGTQSALAGGWIVLALIGVLGGLAAYAIHEGRSFHFKMEMRGVQMEVEIGPETTPPAAEVISSPICDTMPPMNC